jgi:hypothetical protein
MLGISERPCPGRAGLSLATSSVPLSQGEVASIEKRRMDATTFQICSLEIILSIRLWRSGLSIHPTNNPKIFDKRFSLENKKMST